MELKHFSPPDVPSEILDRCRILFSSSYGVWSPATGHNKSGKQIRISAARLQRELLFDSQCRLVAAMIGDEIIGYGCCRRFPVPKPLEGNALWITQLVVHQEHRGKIIASILIKNALEDSDVAAGIVTIHPHAVRALEAATGKVVLPSLVLEYAPLVLSSSGVPYLMNNKIEELVLKTNFLIDHTQANAARERLPNWKLGRLQEGDEYIALVLLAAPPSTAAWS